jgi:pimeloyl-ACP methyl ester carboxylesterase
MRQRVRDVGTEVEMSGNEPGVRDETVTLDGLRFHYRDWGDPAAPAVVLLHAYTQHARTWDTVARSLAQRFRVLALDHRGFGESEWASDYHELRLVGDLAGFADALGLGAFSAVGFSMSASTAVTYALLYPDRVRRLVLLEGFTEGDEQGDEPWIQAMRDHMGRLRSLPESFASFEEAVAAFRPLAPHAAEEELRHWMGGGLRQRPDVHWDWRSDPALRGPGQLGRLNAPQDVLRRRLAQVTCPMLLLAGAESWMVESTHRMAQRNPRARTVIVPEAGHWVPLDNPRGFLVAVNGFLTAE